MDERAAAHAGAEHRPDAGGGYQDDEISLQPYVDTLWRYRRLILATTVLVGLLFIVLSIGLLVISPSERVASIRFRLLFDGAAQNKYPNGTPFSPMEIVAAPVIAEVFRANELHRFGKYENFKDILFVQQSNPEVELLEYEYQARLADSKLTPVDRVRLEAEFKSKRETLTDPSFALSLRRSERFTALPRDLLQKVLTDTLATWAKQAESQKGVTQYNIPILSSKVLARDSIEGNDYLVAADRLRSQAVRIMSTIDELEKVPGALTVRTKQDDISLPEIRARLEDVLRFDLEPLLGIIRTEGVTKNARLVSLYAENMVFQLRLDKQEIEARARALQGSLRDYVSQTAAAGGVGEPSRSPGDSRQGGFDTPGLMPQLSESFLDRLQTMSVLTQKGEMEYRRKLTDQVIDETRRVATIDKELQYYEDLLKTVRGIGSRTSGSPELVTLITTRSRKAFESIEKATSQLNALYHEISALNLNPVAGLFAITGPFIDHTTSARPLGRLGMSLLFVTLGTLVGMSVVVLLFTALHRKPAIVVSPTPHA